MKKLLKNKSIDLLDLVGKIDLVSMYHIMRKSSLFIGNDSGLMHLAALAKLPTVGLFGPSDFYKIPTFWFKNIGDKKSKELQRANELRRF